MRLVGNVQNEKQAFTFYSYLLERGIHSTYEKQIDPETKATTVAIWIYEEDEVDRAIDYLNAFKAYPNDPQFAVEEFPQAPPQPPDLLAKEKEERFQKKKGEPPRRKEKKKRPFTALVLFVCILLYIWNTGSSIQMVKQGGELAVKLGFTPLQKVMMFDYPLANQKIDALLAEYPLAQYKTLEELPPTIKEQFNAAAKIPNWRGVMAFFVNWLNKKPDTASIKGPLFKDIRQGEVWRFFTPCLLHGGLLHILFNMAWVWILMPQIEERLSKWKLLLFIAIVAIVANVAQYLVSGPYFLGFSGVIVGYVGFIWVRQKVAPWEGYPLQRIAIIFVIVYVVAMFGIEIFALVKSALSTEEGTTQIANTAHIIGGLTGALLGRFSFFARGLK